MVSVQSGLADERLVRYEAGSGGVPGAVAASGSLLWTGQIFPQAVDSGISVQADSCVMQLEKMLQAHGSTLKQVVRLHVVAASAEIFEPALQRLIAAFPAGQRPVITSVVGGLPGGSLVAIDAVALATHGAMNGVVIQDGVAVLPEGTRIFIAGQAESSDDLAEATTKTLESLQRTLEWLDRSNADIVQLKAFVQPMSDDSVAVVRSAVQTFFGGRAVPPLVLVEWRSGATVPIEIELVAWGGPISEGAPAAEYLTPPFMKSSPVYARVVRTSSSSLIFTGGLGEAPAADVLAAGDAAAAAAAEVTGAFALLQRLMDVSGSDLKHLVKATYYVSGDAVSLGLNQLRPRYYDALRPPAASKAIVPGVGYSNRTLTMDMIAVPVPRPR